MSEYGDRLLEHHQELLRASAISPGVADARGYVSVTEKSRLEAAGFSPVQRQVPGLLIPVRGVTGEVTGYEYRPDTPRVTDAGKTIKYEKPTGSQNKLDVPSATLPSLPDPRVQLWVTEGARKVDAAVTAGLACVGLAGVWGWRCTNGSGGKVALPDFHEVALNDRVVVICFDSDVMSKPEVRKAVQAFRQFLFSRGADTRVCVLPDENDKVGLDDFLANGGTKDTLEELVRDTLPEDAADRALPEHETPEVEPEDGHGPLDECSRLLRGYVAAHKHVIHVCVAWIAHAYAIDAFYTTPRLIVESPEPECGKSMLLDTMAFCLMDPVTDVSISGAALARTLQNRSPAILLDECDKTIGRGDAAQSESLALLLAVANSGYRRGKTVTRCMGPNNEPTELPTFAAMVFAGLNSRLDRAFRTRAISLWMDRAEPRVEFEWTEDLADTFAAARGRLGAWAKKHEDEIRSARPERPPWLKGRLAEIWLPLMRVGHVAGDPWPRRILEAATELSGKARPEHESWSVALLRAARDVFGDRDRIHSGDLIEGLNELEDAGWASWNDGEGLRPIDFTNRVIKQFKLHHSKSIQIGDKNRKGYEREWFETVWARYCPKLPPDPDDDDGSGGLTGQGRQTPPSQGPLPVKPVNPLTDKGIQPNPYPSTATEPWDPEPLPDKGVDGLTGSEPQKGATDPSTPSNPDDDPKFEPERDYEVF